MAEDQRQEEEQELIAVEDEEELEQAPTKEGDEEEEEEQRLGASEDEDEGKDELRSRRRDERKSRRQRQKDARDRDGREMEYLRNRHEFTERRLNELETRMGAGEVSGIDQRITQFKSQIKLADQVIAKAVSAQKGEDLVEAQNIRDGLRDNLRTLENAKTQIARRETAEEAPAPSPRMLKHAEDFMHAHGWWDPEGGDEDSLIVSAIDNALILERYDPTTKEYWDELADRVAERLPHTVEGAGDDDDDQPQRRPRGGGPRFRTGGRERPLKPNEVYISPDRKAAMVDAGIWEDPDTRQRYLKQYAEWDREHQDELKR
jgi:hypothetical protein